MLKQAIGHGGVFIRKAKRRNHAQVHSGNGLLETVLAAQPKFVGFDYLFSDLIADQQNTLQPGPATIQALRALGAAMAIEQTNLPVTTIPAGYTYFGQFVDHDITKQEVAKKTCQAIFDITRDEFFPLTIEQIRTNLTNERTAPFDLDSLYGAPARRRGAKMVLGPNAQNLPTNDPPFALPAGKDPPNNDLPRASVESKKFAARQALIGDQRNDENLIDWRSAICCVAICSISPLGKALRAGLVATHRC